VQIIARPYEDVVLKTITYTGDGEASQSIAGLGFQSTQIEITLNGVPVKMVYAGQTSRMYDTDIGNYRSTIDGEHLTIDSDGFTIEKDGGGNESGVSYFAICYR